MKRSRRLRKFGIDAHQILPGLYQGSKPAFRHERRWVALPLKAAGFDSLVLSAKEFQLPADEFPGVRVLHVPLDDHTNRLTKSEWKQIAGAADWVATEVRSGRRVLVTCWMGINRSGIITALAAMMLTGWDGTKAVQHVQDRRPHALSNQSFAAHVRAVSA